MNFDKNLYKNHSQVNVISKFFFILLWYAFMNKLLKQYFSNCYNPLPLYYLIKNSFSSFANKLSINKHRTIYLWSFIIIYNLLKCFKKPFYVLFMKFIYHLNRIFKIKCTLRINFTF